MANKSGKAKKQAPIIPPLKELLNMNKKKLINTSKKAQNKLKKQLNSAKTAAKSYGLVFDGDDIGKSLDSLWKDKSIEAINQYEQAKPKIEAKASQISLENDARAANLQANLQSASAVKFSDIKTTQQKKVEKKINEIENSDLKDIANSIFSSVAAGVNKQLKEKVPESLNVQEVGLGLFNLIKTNVEKTKFVTQKKAEFKKATDKLKLKCNTFNGGPRKCKKALADAEAKFNELSQNVGLDKALVWAQAELAKFQPPKVQA